MNEKNRGLLVIGIFAILLLAIPVSMFFANKDAKGMIEEIETYINDDKENTLIYLGSSSCSYCELYDPVIKEASKNNDFEYVYYDISTLSQSDTLELANLVEQPEGIGTPHTVLVGGGEIIDFIRGYVEEAPLVEFLIKNDVVNKDDAVYEPIVYKYFDEINDLFASTENQIIYLGSATCSWCAKFTPVMEKLSNDEGFEYNYFDLAEIGRDEYMEYVEMFNQPDGIGTPHTVIVKDGEILATLGGYVDEAGLRSFLEENEIIK